MPFIILLARRSNFKNLYFDSQQTRHIAVLSNSLFLGVIQIIWQIYMSYAVSKYSIFLRLLYFTSSKNYNVKRPIMIYVMTPLEDRMASICIMCVRQRIRLVFHFSRSWSAIRTTVNQRYYRPWICGSKLRVVPNRFKTVTVLKSVDT